MNRAIFALGATAGGLLTVLVYTAAMPRDEPLLPRRAPGQPAHAAAVPDAMPGAVGVELADTLLQRPLFRPGRRPYGSDVEATTAEAAGTPRLAGILATGPGEGAAIFSTGDRSETVPVGGRIGDWRLLTVAPGEVVVETPEGRRVLTTRFEDAEPAAPEELAPLSRRPSTARPPR